MLTYAGAADGRGGAAARGRGRGGRLHAARRARQPSQVLTVLALLVQKLSLLALLVSRRARQRSQVRHLTCFTSLYYYFSVYDKGVGALLAADMLY